ncbi:hypothetical protein [Streptomyces alboviridis]|uniref:hypothetical protein n=1 Tax=Streptomyces alboviridis TaxID=67269 RepID=UPI000517A5B3|nr:hypothetical protein [Streptomyces alboviridis]
MASIKYPVCGMRGRLADAEVIKLQNLAHTPSIYNWDNADLTCQLPEGHADEERDQHIQWVTEQQFGEVKQDWWASWLDVDGLRDEAAMFTGPSCPATLDEGKDLHGDRIVWACALLAGHVQYHGDDLHMTMEGAEFRSSTRIAWRDAPQAEQSDDNQH